jgi:type IV pilus assembly protein PilV
MLRSVFARKSLRGFSMVEVLVALVVLSVGMLGIAGLYVITLRSGGSAIARTHAVNLANDIADRIRANRLAIASYNTTGGATIQSNSCVGGGAICTRAQMAGEDLFVWRTQITAALPGASTGTVAVTPGLAVNAQGMRSPSTYTITITWADTDQTTLSHVLVVQI